MLPGLRLTLTGAALGALAALGTSRVLASSLFGVEPSDPMTFLAVTTFLVSAGLLASYLPARRARSVAPADVLRCD